MAPPPVTGFNFSAALSTMAAPFRALGVRIGRIDLRAVVPFVQVALLIASFIALLGGFFAFLALPFMGAAGIVAFTTPMFALPPLGFVLMVVSLVGIFRLLPARP